MSFSEQRAAEWAFREIKIGDIFRVERTFTADDVARFAQLSGDFSPLHMDENYAATTEFGGRVVHGMLLATLFSQLVGMYIPGKHALYLGQDLVFRRPVLLGETVTASAKVTGKSVATRTVMLTTEIHNQEGKVVVSGAAKVKVRDREALEETALPVTPATAKDSPVGLVVGASRGIGAEIARTLGASGIAVAVNYYRNAEQAKLVVQAIQQQGGEAIAVQADVRERMEAKQLVDTVVERFGRLDLLVNGAVGELQQRPIIELDWSNFQEHLDYQVKAVMNVCQAAYPYLQNSGRGAIVNLLSQVATGSPPTLMADYVTGKYALKGLSKALAAEWATNNIRVNTVSPGLTPTDLTQHYSERIFKMEASRTPLKRLARPSDIALAVAYLLSEEASFLTGIDIAVTGGQAMS